MIVDPFGSPTLRHDLRVFDRAFGLPAPPSLRVLQPVGKVPPFNPNNLAMVAKAGETTGDVEWAHAIAPGADILVAETPVAETAAGGGRARRWRPGTSTSQTQSVRTSPGKSTA